MGGMGRQHKSLIYISMEECLLGLKSRWKGPGGFRPFSEGEGPLLWALKDFEVLYYLVFFKFPVFMPPPPPIVCIYGLTGALEAYVCSLESEIEIE